MRIAIVLLALATAACAAAPAPVVAPQACPAPVPYSDADNQALAKAMVPLKGTIIDRVLDDYHQERLKLKACRK